MKKCLLFIFILFTSKNSHAFLGSEMVPLLELVAGQITQIEKLTETVGVAKNQIEVLKELNKGISDTVSQIESIQSIVTRTHSLDPKAIRSLSDLNQLLSEAKDLKNQIDFLTKARIKIANQSISQSALLSDNAYKMGEEMIHTGSILAQESKGATPGRASQITAASGSAQMLSSGVELQTLSQILEIETLNLEFQKAIVEDNLREKDAQKQYLANQLSVRRNLK